MTPLMDDGVDVGSSSTRSPSWSAAPPTSAPGGSPVLPRLHSRRAPVGQSGPNDGGRLGGWTSASAAAYDDRPPFGRTSHHSAALPPLGRWFVAAHCRQRRSGLAPGLVSQPRGGPGGGGRARPHPSSSRSAGVARRRPDGDVARGAAGVSGAGGSPARIEPRDPVDPRDSRLIGIPSELHVSHYAGYEMNVKT